MSKPKISPEELSARADRIIFEIVQDIESRKKLGKKWKKLDDLTQEEIKNVWIKIALKHFPPTK